MWIHVSICLHFSSPTLQFTRKLICPALMYTICSKHSCISITMAATRITVNNNSLTLMHQSHVFEGDIIHHVYHMQSPAPPWKDFGNWHIIQWGMCSLKVQSMCLVKLFSPKSPQHRLVQMIERVLAFTCGYEC